MVSLVNNTSPAAPVSTPSIQVPKVAGQTLDQWSASLAKADKHSGSGPSNSLHHANSASRKETKTTSFMPGKAGAESRSIQAKAAKATADADTKDLRPTTLQSAVSWVQNKTQAATTSTGRVFNAIKDQTGDTLKATSTYLSTGDTTKLNQLNGRAEYRANTTQKRIERDFTDGPDRANQTTGADTAAKSGKLITSMGRGNITQAKQDAAELEKTTSNLPSGAAKDQLREKTDQIQDNLQLGTGTKQGTKALIAETGSLSKGITSNVTNVNMRINTLSASNVQNHSRSELISNYKSLAARVEQMPAGEVKLNMSNGLQNMKESVYTGTTQDVAAGVKQLRSISTSAEATANDKLQQTHKVVQGDTLTKVMADKSIDPSERSAILKANNITTRNLAPGQTIILPSRTIPH